MGICEHKEVGNMSKKIVDEDEWNKWISKIDAKTMSKRDFLINELERLEAADEYDSKLHEILSDPKYKDQSLHKLSESEINEIFDKYCGDQYE